MPSKSKKQARLMRAVAHGWKPSRIKGPTRAVAQEFVNADKRRGKVQSYQFGGLTSPMMYGATRRAMRPQPGAQMTHTTGGPGRPVMRQPQKSKPLVMPPHMRRDLRAMPPQRGGLGQVGDALGRQGMQGDGKFRGRRMAPPPNKQPGGGNPYLGRRNPMMRGTQRFQPTMGRRGPTSFLR